MRLRAASGWRPRTSPRPLLAADETCDVKGATRVVAIGDVHGAYRSSWRCCASQGWWTTRSTRGGGKAYFVQTGDLLDRGGDTRKVLDLMLRLEGEARRRAAASRRCSATTRR